MVIFFPVEEGLWKDQLYFVQAKVVQSILQYPAVCTQSRPDPGSKLH